MVPLPPLSRRLVATSALAAALLLASCARLPERPNVLIVTIDSLRADRVASPGRATTPHLDALAAEGLLFTAAVTPRAKTTPALASLHTGLYPHDHGVRDLAMPLNRGVPLLAESFRRDGYRTAAIVGSFALRTDQAGLARGFDAWVEDLPEVRGVAPLEVRERGARSLTDGALRALGLATGRSADGAGPTRPFVRRDRPWFLWLHYADPHGPYEPPPEHVVEPDAAEPLEPSPGSTDPGDRAPSIAPWNAHGARLADGRIDAAHARALYDGEVRHVDAQLGRLLDALRDADLLAGTLVVVTADHGESLGEHGTWFDHGEDTYDATCRVPLVVALPDTLDAPAEARTGVRDAPVSLADLAPTVLELAGLRPLRSTLGRSRVVGVSRAEQMLGGEPPRRGRAVFCETLERSEEARALETKAVRLGDWKLHRRFELFVSPQELGKKQLARAADELYDLRADPGERVDLGAAVPPDAPWDELQQELDRFVAADARFAELGAELQRRRERLERVDPDTLRALQALGY